MTALLLEAPPIEASSEPELPDPPEPGHVPERVWELRLDGALLATFKRQGVRKRRRNGPGTAVVTCSMFSQVDPAAAYLWDAQGKARTWKNSRLEIWVWRDGVIRHQGPVVIVDEDWVAGEATVTALTREGYVKPLRAGMRGATELFPAGHFDLALSGWTEHGESGRQVTTVYPYRDPRALVLSGTAGGFERGLLVLPDESAGNTVRWTVPVRMSGDGWWPEEDDGDPVIYRVHHYADGVLRGTYEATLSRDEYMRSPSPYYRLNLATPQTAGAFNEYQVDLMAGITDGSQARIGEVTAVRWDNISSRDGWDRATYASAVFQEVADDDPSRPWTRQVTPAGSTWNGAKRELKIQHPEYVSLLGDLEPWGEWWVIPGTHCLRWAPTRGSVIDPEVYGLTPASISNLRRAVDATRAATRALAYANGEGQDGPTREEGLASVAGGAVLDAVIPAPENTDVRDLEEIATDYLENEGRAETTVQGDPRKPMTVGGLPGQIQYLVEPGSRLTLSGRLESPDGHLSRAALDDIVRIEEETCDDVSDEVSWAVSVL
jgi:hypothetical protein